MSDPKTAYPLSWPLNKPATVHPDNPDTGDHAAFLRLQTAYDLIAQNLRK